MCNRVILQAHIMTPNDFCVCVHHQLLRKRHIGNDIVTIVFQEPGAQPFTPKSIRSHFQHVFIIVQVHEPCTDKTYYRSVKAHSSLGLRPLGLIMDVFTSESVQMFVILFWLDKIERQPRSLFSLSSLFSYLFCHSFSLHHSLTVTLSLFSLSPYLSLSLYLTMSPSLPNFLPHSYLTHCHFLSLCHSS